MCAFSVVLITPAHSPEQPTVVYSLPLQGGCGGPASITSTTPQPSARSSTSQPPVALVAHGESAGGISPPAARRTVRKPLGLHGSHRPAVGFEAEAPVSEQGREAYCCPG